MAERFLFLQRIDNITFHLDNYNILLQEIYSIIQKDTNMNFWDQGNTSRVTYPVATYISAYKHTRGVKLSLIFSSIIICTNTKDYATKTNQLYSSIIHRSARIINILVFYYIFHVDKASLLNSTRLKLQFIIYLKKKEKVE